MWLHTVSVRFQKLSYSFDSNNTAESPSRVVFTSRFHNVFPQVTHCGLAPPRAFLLALPTFLSVVYRPLTPWTLASSGLRARCHRRAKSPGTTIPPLHTPLLHGNCLSRYQGHDDKPDRAPNNWQYKAAYPVLVLCTPGASACPEMWRGASVYSSSKASVALSGLAEGYVGLKKKKKKLETTGLAGKARLLNN